MENVMFSYLGKREYKDALKNENSRLQRLSFDGDLKLGGLYFHKGKLYRILVKEYYTDDCFKPFRVDIYPGVNYKGVSV